jgi:MFS family permease
VLKEPAQRVGIAQMVMMAPAIVFMLLGGAVADRADCRRLLFRYHLLAVLPPLVLAGIVAAGALGYFALIGYGLAMGTLGAFVVPARDALLTRVVRRGRERAIAVTSACQFICQLAGIVVAGWAGRIGAQALLVARPSSSPPARSQSRASRRRPPPRRTATTRAGSRRCETASARWRAPSASFR